VCQQTGFGFGFGFGFVILFEMLECSLQNLCRIGFRWGQEVNLSEAAAFFLSRGRNSHFRLVFLPSSAINAVKDC
jgi:hypothetical protein